MLLAPLAEFFVLEFFLHRLLVLGGVVIRPLAPLALQFKKIILAHYDNNQSPRNNNQINFNNQWLNNQTRIYFLFEYSVIGVWVLFGVCILVIGDCLK